MTNFEVKSPFKISVKQKSGETRISKQIVGFHISHLRYIGYVNLALDCFERVSEKNSFNAAVRTARILKQAKLIDDSGEQHAIDFITAHNLPIPVAKQILDNVTPEELPEGEILGKGDGVTSPIHVRLGTPIMVDKGDPIQELEFLARTYGDVEQVLAEPNKLSQTVALIQFVAKPIGMQAMPTWAPDLIELTDGSLITEKVLPRFLE